MTDISRQDADSRLCSNCYHYYCATNVCTKKKIHVWGTSGSSCDEFSNRQDENKRISDAQDEFIDPDMEAEAERRQEQIHDDAFNTAHPNHD